ncbi:MAG: hypothetical protein OSJ64_01210, partial [Firmicutes bacterium]|nr:hypothetical protein [Bacillota bacterium]
PVFGWLPSRPEFALSERHLGLYCSGEVSDLQQKMDLLAEEITANCDLPALLAATERAAQPPLTAPVLPEPLAAPVRIGLAQDAAFNFYYQDSLAVSGRRLSGTASAGIGGQPEPAGRFAQPFAGRSALLCRMRWFYLSGAQHDYAG